MFNNLNQTDISVEATSEEDLLLAMGGEEESSKTKGKTKGKSEPDADEDDTDDSSTTKKKPKGASSKSKKDTSAPKSKTAVSALSKTDFEMGFGSDEEDEEDVEEDEPTEEEIAAAKKKKKDEKKKTAAKKVVVEEDEDEEEDIEANEDLDDADEDADEDEEEENEEVGELTVPNFLKARVNLLISKGEWVDFEGSKDAEWDEDTFADMELQQREYKKAELADEIMDSFGPIGRDIAEYTKNGGNPEDLIDIFKEQQRVENLAIDTEDQQRAVVMKFAIEYQKMKPDRAKKYIDGLIADKEIASTAAEAKEEMEADLKKQSETLKSDAIKEQAAKEKKTQENIKKFATDINTLLNSRNDIPADEKRDILRILTKHDKKLPNGSPVNEFYFMLNEFRKDLPNYLELVRFVKDPKKYKASEQNKGKSATADKAFSLLRSDNKKKSAKSNNISTATGTAGKSKKQSGFKLL